MCTRLCAFCATCCCAPCSYVHDENYWKRVCLENQKWDNCQIAEHGMSWKQLFFERYLSELLEGFGVYVGTSPPSLFRSTDVSSLRTGLPPGVWPLLFPESLTRRCPSAFVAVALLPHVFRGAMTSCCSHGWAQSRCACIAWCSVMFCCTLLFSRSVVAC